MEEENKTEEICDICKGTGFVPVDEVIWAGEPHTAPTGEEPCICNLDEPFEE
jgi:hypothetical protein